MEQSLSQRNFIVQQGLVIWRICRLGDVNFIPEGLRHVPGPVDWNHAIVSRRDCIMQPSVAAIHERLRWVKSEKHQP
jgi:hypothetical protein